MWKNLGSANRSSIDGGAFGDDIELTNVENIEVNGGAGADHFHLVNVIKGAGATNSSIQGDAGNDFFSLKNTTNVIVEGNGDKDTFDIEGNHTNLAVEGGIGEDNFYASGNGEMTLHGGAGDGAQDNFEIHDFTGTANITVEDFDRVQIRDGVNGDVNPHK